MKVETRAKVRQHNDFWVCSNSAKQIGCRSKPCSHSWKCRCSLVVIAAGGLDQVSWEQARWHYYASNFITGSLWKAGTFVLVLAWDPWTQAITWYITRTTLLKQGRKRWQKSRITFISFAHFKFFEGPNWKETTVYSPLCAGWAQWAALAVTQT